MSSEQNKVLIERCYRAFGDGDLQLLDEAAAPDYAYHDPGNPSIHTWTEHRAQLSALHRSMSELRFNIDELVAEDDRVAVRWTMRGTVVGSLMGVSAPGRRIEMAGHSMYRLARGKVAVAYSLSDLLGLKRQLQGDTI